MDSHSSYKELIDEAATVSVLAIDDVDKIYVSAKVNDTENSFQAKTFFTILNRRYINERPTLITANMLDISPYVGAAALSRMRENGVILKMEGKDYRDSLMK
jgi:DNA replication protein DnaC